MTVWSRIFKSENGGGSWSEIGGFPETPQAFVTTDAADPDLLYYGSLGVGVYRSEDGGETWSLASTGLPSLQVSRVFASPTAPDTVFASVNPDLFRSTDAGESWQEIGPAGAGNISWPRIHPLDGNRIFLMEGNTALRVHRSDDGGTTWALASTGLPDTTSLEQLTLDPLSPDRAFVLLGRALYETLDGETWSLVGNIPSPPATLDISSLLATPGGAGTVLLAGGPAFADSQRITVVRSLDGGQSWDAAGLVGENASELVEVDGRVFVFTDGGLLETDDLGDTWFRTGPGINAADVRALATSPSDPQVVVGGLYECHRARFARSEDAGRTWQVGPSLGAPRHVGSFATTEVAPSLILAGAEFQLYRSTNAGETWQELASPGGNVFEKLAMHPTDPSRVFAASSTTGYSRSADGGVTWETDLLASPFDQLSSIVIDPGDPDVMFVGSSNAGVARSLDGGIVWQPLGGALELVPVHAMAAVADGAGTKIFAATYFHHRVLWRSITQGLTWGGADTGLDGARVRSISADPTTPGTLIAATDSGVYRSTDTGWTWTPDSDGLTDLDTYATAVRADGRFFVSTANHGVFSSGDIVFADGFESGDTSAWSSSVP